MPVNTSNYSLAQLNVALMREPLDSPLLADFVANLDRINATAEASPGFIWRLQGDGGDATAFRPLGENVLINVSVWRDAASLSHYVYKSAHVEIIRRRKEWFDRMEQAYVVLWWVKAGHIPTIAEAVERLDRLRNYGPSPDAFTFRQTYPAPDEMKSEAPFSIGAECPTN